MITGKINLSALKHVEMEAQGQSGKVKGMFIPYEANHIFVSEKGSKFVDLIFFEMKEKKDYATHMIKQSFPKDVRDAMSDEEKKSTPILGNLNMNESRSSEQSGAASSQVFTPTDDLPF